MNDFTKEELEEIHKAYSHYYKHVYEGDIEPPAIIFGKIESLIDNYCEHEPSDANHKQFRWQLCFKCGDEYK